MSDSVIEIGNLQGPVHMTLTPGFLLEGHFAPFTTACDTDAVTSCSMFASDPFQP